MSEFQREERYIVLKMSDIEFAMLGSVEKAALDRVVHSVDVLRGGHRAGIG